MRIAFLAVAALALAALPAQARVHHGGASAAINAPVLQAVSVPFGVKTLTGRGNVRLSSLDVTTTSVHPVTFSGLGLMSPTAPACAFWTLTFVSNTSGRPSTDFTIIAPGTAEGSSAITPVPSSTGNQNLAGTYTWNVSCTDSGGNSSNTVTLAYTPTSNAITVGDTEALNAVIYPSGFGNVAGAKITAAVGMDRHTGGFNPQPGIFTNQVTITPADTSRRPYLAQLGVSGSKPGNVLFYDWVLSGALTGSPTNAIIGIVPTANNALSDIVFDTIKYYGSETMLGGNSAQGAISFFPSQGSCTSNCGVTNSEFNYVESGTTPKTNTYLRFVTFRYVYNNCLFFTTNSNFEVSDTKCLSPMQRYQGAHPDNAQICDTCVPGPGVLIQRFLSSQADGDYFAQGPVFGGTIMNVPGYVGPGTNVFTKTGSAFLNVENGNLVVIPGFISSAAGVTMTCIGSCSTATQVTLNGLAPTTIGSAGSPVNMYGPNVNNLMMSGIMDTQAGPYGIAMGGNAGTSYLYDYDYVGIDTQNPAIGTFTGSITGGVLTATTTATSNIPGQTAWINGPGGSMGRLNYSGCVYTSSCTVNGKTSGSDAGPGVFTTSGPNVASGTIQISGAYPGQAVPAFEPSNCNLPDVQGGSFGLDRGTFSSGYFPRNASCTVGVNFPAANMTVGSHAFGPTASGYTPPGGAVTGADYASGVLPAVYLAAHSWTAADTADDIERIECLARKPSLGGKRDAGGGLGYGAVTPATNANGSGGGDLMYFNGTSHVAGRHVTGCEAIP